MDLLEMVLPLLASSLVLCFVGKLQVVGDADDILISYYCSLIDAGGLCFYKQELKMKSYYIYNRHLILLAAVVVLVDPYFLQLCFLLEVSLKTSRRSRSLTYSHRATTRISLASNQHRTLRHLAPH